MSSGYLSVQLDTDSDQPMVLFIDEYDADWDEWFTITGEITHGGNLEVELDLDAGDYAFSVISLGDGGNFTLNATLEQ